MKDVTIRTAARAKTTEEDFLNLLINLGNVSANPIMNSSISTMAYSCNVSNVIISYLSGKHNLNNLGYIYLSNNRKSTYLLKSVVQAEIDKADIEKNIEKAERAYNLISKVKDDEGKPWSKKQLERLKKRVYEEYVFDYEWGELDN